VQFNQLEQLIEINQAVSQQAAASTGGASQSGNSQTPAVQPGNLSAPAAAAL